MKAIISTPCAKCPFRGRFRDDEDYLRTGRRTDIVHDMLRGGEFHCHETTEYDDDAADGDGDMVVTGDSALCAGAALVMLRADRDTQMLRILERIGSVDLAEFVTRNASVELWTYDEIVAADAEVETCSVVGPNCLAPAGWMIGGEAVHGTVAADSECVTCGEPVCSECLTEHEMCDSCDPDTDEQDDYDY